MLLAAYMVTGFVIASVYAVGMLRGRRDRYIRLGFADPVHGRGDRGTPIQVAVGDIAARAIARGSAGQVRGDGVITRADPNQTEYLGGVLRQRQVMGGIRIPGLGSILPGSAPNTVVTGLDQIPDDQRPPADRSSTWRGTRWSASPPRSSCSPPGLPSPWWRKRDLPRPDGSCVPRRLRGSRRWWR